MFLTELCVFCPQSTREADIKVKSESRVKLFCLDPDAQVRANAQSADSESLLVSCWMLRAVFSQLPERQQPGPH